MNADGSVRVGMGERCELGGTWNRRTLSCPNGDYTRPFMHHCDSPLCPTCAGHWVDERAKATTARLIAFEKLAQKNRLRVGAIRHFSVSPPAGMAPATFLRKVIPLLKWGGLVAGTVVYHSERQYDKKKHLWHYSPHFHVHGWGWMKNAAEVHEKTGWVYVNKGTRRKLYDSVRYNFDHCAILEGRHAVRYFGLMGYRVLKREVERKDTVDEMCPKCGAALEMHVCYDSGDVEVRRAARRIHTVAYRLRLVKTPYSTDLHGKRRKIDIVYRVEE